MNTEILDCSGASVLRAAEIIKAGGLVAFPTETVYGLGANGLSDGAVARIFEAKGRPGDNPLILHISEIGEIEGLISGPLPERARRLAEAYWPGPLTMVLPKSDKIPDQVTAGLDTVAIRMPSHPAARALIHAAGLPIAAPSANRSGRPSPTRAEHVMEDMSGKIEMVLDGGGCRVGLESTVVDMTGETARILRPGGVTPEMVDRVLGGVQVDDSVLRPLKEGEKVRSPGMKYRHYAPKGHLTIVSGAPDAVAKKIAALYDECVRTGQRSAILARSKKPYAGRFVRELGEAPDEIAAALFAALREMDDARVDRIFSEAVDAFGLGLAIMNRMGRAAAFDVIEV